MNRKSRFQKHENKFGWIVMAVLLMAVLAGILLICQGCSRPKGRADNLTSEANTVASTTLPSETGSETGASAEERYVQSVGNVIYNATVFDPKLSLVPCPVVKTLNAYQAKDTILSLYGAHFIPDWVSRQAEDSGSYFTIATQEGAHIAIGIRGVIECKTKFGNDSEIIYANMPEQTYYYPQTDFSWGTRQSCIEDVQSFFRPLGIKTVGCAAMAVTSERYEAEYQFNLPLWEEEKAMGMYKFVRDHIDYEDDELFYIVYMQQMLSEVPIYRFSIYSSSKLEELDGTRIYAIYSRNGLEKIVCNFLYEIQQPGELKSVLRFEKAVDAFNRYVNDDLLLEEPLTIGYVGLEYIPDGSIRDEITEVTMKPYWVFRAEKPADGNWPYFEDYLLDAVTGQVIIQ